jgi:hypothetical protein
MGTRGAGVEERQALKGSASFFEKKKQKTSLVVLCAGRGEAK